MRQQLLDPVDHTDNVCAGLTLNINDDRGIQIHPRRLHHIFDSVGHRGHIREAHRRAVSISDNDGAILVAREELIVGLDGKRLARTVERSLSLINIGSGQRGSHIFQAQPIRRQRGGIRLNSHRRFLSAANRNQPHARDLRNLLSHRCVRKILDLRKRQRLRGQRQGKNRRVRGIYFAINRRVRQVRRQVGLRGIDRGLDLLLLDINILIQVEL